MGSQKALPDLPGTDRILELVAEMSGQPVLMAVDFVADRFIVGSPKRISREAPVLILRHESDRFVPGGGANAVSNVAALGGRPLPLGVIGDDQSGTALLDLMTQAGVSTLGLARVHDYRTPTKVRILGGGRHSIKQQIVRYDVEDEISESQLGGPVLDVHRRALEEWSGQSRVAVLSDYGYGSVTPSRLAAVRGALAADSCLICDSRFRLGEFEGIDGATPNEEEAEGLYGASFDDDLARVAAAGDLIREKLGAKFLLMTRGSCGMSLVEQTGSVHIPVHGSTQVADVTGAGDTVIGTFALAMAAGSSPLEAALLANYAGGLVVQKLGTATVTAEELAAAVDSNPELLQEIRWESF